MKQSAIDRILQRAGKEFQAGRRDSAGKLYAQVVEKAPRHSLALRMLGVIAEGQGRDDEALRYMEASVKGDAPDAIAMYNLALFLDRRKRYDEALLHYRKAVALNPSYESAWNNLGALRQRQGFLTEAEECCRKVLAIDPRHVMAYGNLGNILKEQGRSAEAVAAYRTALKLKPDFFAMHSNLLQALCYTAVPDQELLAEHRAFAESLKAFVPASGEGCAGGHNDKGSRKLRIGYVSPDFRLHSVAYFVEPILRHHCRDHFDITCYSDVAVPDRVTERLRALATQWRDIAGKDDAAVAGLVAADGIDILVDLAGHSGGNRLGVFFRKPAPVQVSYIGYPATTGLSALDFRLTDGWTDPPGQEAFHTETLVRLAGGFLCYQPPAEAPPPPDQAPVQKNGFITFGSFNYLPKVSPAVLDLWSAVLKAVPASRLCLKAKSFNDAPTRERYEQAFAARGIGSDRLILKGYSAGLVEHLSAYGEIDIALDTFPYNGTTTTLEALWMGVPVLALQGTNHRSRVSWSILSRAGLTGLVAPSEEKYIALAQFLASDAERLTGLHRGLRTAVARSSLCDARGCAQSLEEAYRAMWEWAKKR
ncbi:MAG: tetratricopeptide repeat protein [Deltaproteobacteria bacterium]|nr:tetratricopeptide repeat protein [Deltaproteobacteria bacterium]